VAATYNPAHPTARDRVRANLGDTDVEPDENALHTDAHMDAVLAAYGEALGQSALAHELWARHAQDPSSVGLTGLSVSFANLLEVWAELAKPWLAYQQRLAADTTATLTPARKAQIGVITAGTVHKLR
jgi:hypothetical protein